MFRYVLFILLFNTAVAAALSLLGTARVFVVELIYAHAIGLSCGLPALLVMRHARSVAQMRSGLVLCMLVGVLNGVAVAQLLTQDLPGARPIHTSRLLLSGWAASLLAGYFFFTRQGVARLEQELRLQHRQQEELARAGAALRLRALQAQIEPHFLFNTLAHIAALIRSDPPQAERVLGRLSAFLRSTLERVRSEVGSLGDELELVENYLRIIELRMGPRLRWSIHASEAARRCPFPLMVLQPLVENAIQHGIDARADGGSVRIVAQLADTRLQVRVEDDGAGLPGGRSQPGGGVGLSNVRERLQLQYGADARLTLIANVKGGATATVEIPA